MPSVHGHKKRSAPKKAGRKSHRKSPRKSHRKSPRHVKSGHKRSKSGRRVRGGGAEQFVKPVSYAGVSGIAGASAGNWLSRRVQEYYGIYFNPRTQKYENEKGVEVSSDKLNQMAKWGVGLGRAVGGVGGALVGYGVGSAE